MANHHRGEIEAELSGRRYVLCLTLGALAVIRPASKRSAMATRSSPP